MEDFGYSTQQEEGYVKNLIKKSLMIGVTIFSSLIFIYITFSAYSYFSENHEEIKIIEAESDPIKIIRDDEIQSTESMQIDSSIYEDIFGTRKKVKIKVKKAPTAPLPPKQKITTKNEAIKVELDKKDTAIKNSEISNSSLIGQANSEIREPKNIQNSKRYVKVQIAAMTSKSAAETFYNSLDSNHHELLSGLQKYIQEVDLGKRGKFYRVQIGKFYDQIRAEKFCENYILQTSKTRSDCIIVE